MSIKSDFTFICDLCDRSKVQDNKGLPEGWSEIKCEVIKGISTLNYWQVCPKCWPFNSEQRPVSTVHRIFNLMRGKP